MKGPRRLRPADGRARSGASRRRSTGRASRSRRIGIRAARRPRRARAGTCAEAPATPAAPTRERQRDRHQEPHRLAESRSADRRPRSALPGRAARRRSRACRPGSSSAATTGDHHNCTDGETAAAYARPPPYPPPLAGEGKGGVFAFPSEQRKILRDVGARPLQPGRAAVSRHRLEPVAHGHDEPAERKTAMVIG